MCFILRCSTDTAIHIADQRACDETHRQQDDERWDTQEVRQHVRSDHEHQREAQAYEELIRPPAVTIRWAALMLRWSVVSRTRRWLRGARDCR